jgi:DNA-binding NarL/FixJ family response regulator
MAKTASKKILIIDNYPLYSLGLSTLLEKDSRFDIIGKAENCTDALKIAEKEKPNIALMEMRLGKENGLELIPKLKMINPDISILIISVHDERFYAERALRLGARGYVLKTESADVIMAAINTVMDNKIYLSENERDRILQTMAEESKPGIKDWIASLQMLSNRELQVFSFIAKGLGTIEIASRLNLSTKTIDTHKENIKVKLQCNSVQELRQKAIEWANKSGSL